MSFLGGKNKAQPTMDSAPRVPSPGRPASSPIETTIGPNTQIKGDIQGDGGLRVDGVIEGSIEVTGNLVITESAKIRAEIKANNISVAGALQGNVVASRVEILDTGRVWGDLTVKSLLVSEGAYFRGQTFMPQDLKPPQLQGPALVKSEDATGADAGTVVDVVAKE
ncbi:MAG: polymer-forming cytoskeletal protein [Anaerolineae bacterium]|jgi:cytoskeletal protein CcmA (bactofilin family)|nr:polymer-forming cytoskeletal protein [Anaerolineae bacterium]